MRIRICVALVVGLIAAAAAAQSTDPALTAAIADRDKAAIARDAATFSKYTADDYIAVNPNGVLNTKQQRIDGLKAPAEPGARPGTPQRSEFVRTYGPNAAVARLKTDDARILAVWIKDAHGWQVHAIHVVPDVFLPQQPVVPPLKTPEPSTLTAPAGLTGDRAAVFAAFKQIQDAVFSGDHATYEKLTAPEHVRLLPNMVRFGAETNGAVGEPRKQPKYANISVNVWDQLGVVRWHEVGAYAPIETWLTRVFAKKGTTWQQVATASSLAGKATP